jgi:hypothetical protein
MVEVKVKAGKSLSGYFFGGSKGVVDLNEDERGIVWEFISFVDWLMRLSREDDWMVFIVEGRYVVLSSKAMEIFVRGLSERGIRVGSKGRRVKELLRDVGLLRCRGVEFYQLPLEMEVRVDGRVDRVIFLGYVVDWRRALELYGRVRQGAFEKSEVEIPLPELSECPF